MNSKKAEFLMKRQEAQRLLDALRLIAHASDESEMEPDVIGWVDDLANDLHQLLRTSDGGEINLTLLEKTWRAVLHVNGDLALLSPYENDDGHEESKAIDLVFEFLTASGRKLGTSLFRSPEDKKWVEEVLGQSLDLLE